MIKTNQHNDGKEIFSRLQLLMFLRVGFVTLLLGAAIIIQVRETKEFFGEILNVLYLLIVSIYCLTFIYIIALKLIKNLIRFAYLQILLDTVFITSIIFSTGGMESMLSFLYILNIISGSILLYRRGGIIIASFSSLLYISLLVLNFYELINPINYNFLYDQRYMSSEIFYRIFVNVMAFFLVAFLSSTLSEQIKRGKDEIKARQKDIANLEMLKENIIQGISSGLIALDENGRIILFNRGAENIFEITSSNTIRKHIADVFPFLMPYIRHYKRKNFYQLSYEKSGGNQINLLLNISPLREQDGHSKGEILVFQDTTRLTEMEQEVKRMEDLAVVGELAAGIAHEIRNPLASISGSIQVLSDNLSWDKTQLNNRLMDIILREINRLNHLVDDFLQFARPQKVEIEEFDFNQLIVDTLNVFQNSQKWSQQLDVETNLHNTLKMTSDSQQIKQVLWNIFLNACEAMPNGGLIRITTEKFQRNDGENNAVDFVRTTVEDNGPGIDPKLIKDIFKPFSTTKKGGSGLGLAIVKKIVESIGGDITGRNLDTKGAVITITLPCSIEGNERKL